MSKPAQHDCKKYVQNDAQSGDHNVQCVIVSHPHFQSLAFNYTVIMSAPVKLFIHDN